MKYLRWNNNKILWILISGIMKFFRWCRYTLNFHETRVAARQFVELSRLTFLQIISFIRQKKKFFFFSISMMISSFRKIGKTNESIVKYSFLICLVYTFNAKKGLAITVISDITVIASPLSWRISKISRIWAGSSIKMCKVTDNF